MGLNISPSIWQSYINAILGADHPLAFSPTYFSPNIQSLAISPAVNVPIDAVPLVVPLNPVNINNTVRKAVTPKDLTIEMGAISQKSQRKRNSTPARKSSQLCPGVLGTL